MAHRINADWDDAAGIWIATSTEVQGLWTEAVSLEALIAIEAVGVSRTQSRIEPVAKVARIVGKHWLPRDHPAFGGDIAPVPAPLIDERLGVEGACFVNLPVERG